MDSAWSEMRAAFRQARGFVTFGEASFGHAWVTVQEYGNLLRAWIKGIDARPLSPKHCEVKPWTFGSFWPRWMVRDMLTKKGLFKPAKRPLSTGAFVAFVVDLPILIRWSCLKKSKHPRLDDQLFPSFSYPSTSLQINQMLRPVYVQVGFLRNSEALFDILRCGQIDQVKLERVFQLDYILQQKIEPI